MLPVAPHITEVDPNSPAFRQALATATPIMVGTGMNAYSRHEHYSLGDRVVFEEPGLPGELVLRPMSVVEAIGKGLPSCWGVAADKSVTVLRRASWELHDRSGIDVTSREFQRQLTELGHEFAAAGLHKVLELNIASHLFPAGEGMVTSEVTDERTGIQRVTLIPTPTAVKDGDWAEAACWAFDQGEPVVTGICHGCPPRPPR